MKKAVLFPGQGAQFVGMGKDLYDNFPEVRSLFNEADSFLGEKISEACFWGPPQRLKDTLYQQLAIFLVSVASWELFKKRADKLISFFAGLSLGEYSSLYASGALSFKETLLLVRKRAEAMSSASLKNPSCMLAVLGLERKVLESIGGGLFYIANLNSPHQVVISLSQDKKEDIIKLLQSKGAKRVVELEVNGGFHSPFMKEAEELLRKAIEPLEFKRPQVPIVSNVDAKPHTDIEEIKSNLIAQLTCPVLWQASIEFMVSQGVNLFYEVGPSKVLRGLLRKINPDLKVVNFGCLKDFNQ